MVSLAAAHYTNRGIKETGKLSINIVDEALLPKAVRAGCVSGSKEDKSALFDCLMDSAGVPTIADAPVTMVCSVEDVYQTKGRRARPQRGGQARLPRPQAGAVRDADLRVPAHRRRARQVHDVRAGKERSILKSPIRSSVNTLCFLDWRRS